MARPRIVFACTHCGAQQPQWLGRCPECSSWSTLVEETAVPAGHGQPARELLAAADPPTGSALKKSSSSAKTAVALGDIEADLATRAITGVNELDRVLGGGLVPGSVILLGGEPGVGKSTLALQVAAHVQQRVGPVLYVSGEESPEQIRLRAGRLREIGRDVKILSETRVEALAEAWRKLSPSLVVIDSIQTMHTDRVESAPGSVAQVRESAALLSATAKAHSTALLLVGHVTKDGSIAGPRVLEHLVDVVLTFDGDRTHAFRMLRAVKNRFGSTQEVGVFTMTEKGLEGVENPSELFLAERQKSASGSCIVPILEGTRPILVEIQALVAPAGYGTARRTCLGVDDGKVALLLAVLDRRTDIDLVSQDIYVNVTGGVRVAEPSADLPLALAIASSRLDIALPAQAAACGEIGLGGEVRRVPRIDLRLREAARLGFQELLVPKGTTENLGAPALDASHHCRCIEIDNIAAAVQWLRETG